MSSINRRDFLRTTAAGVGTAAFASTARAARRGANDTVRVAVVGVHGQGRRHIDGFEKLDNVEVTALCDISEPILNERADDLDKKTGRKVQRYVDMRELFDNKDIDVVSIATPNHWHSLAAVWAMQAGKDVYVEKPISHNIFEGRQVVRAAKKYNRMCQHGVQGRSAPAIREAIQKLKEGVIGDVYMAKGICYRKRASIGHTPDEPVPPGVHYDMWLGPAPERAFSKNRFIYNWHWFWDYGNGDIGNQGVHEMDLARWGLGVGFPDKIVCNGGKVLWDDDKETPNAQLASFSFPDTDKIMNFEVRPWISNWEGGFGSDKTSSVGVIFYGSEGFMTLKYFWYKTFLGKKHEPGPHAQSNRDEWAQFIKAVRSRNEADLGTTAEDGHISSSLCHLANTAYRLDRTLKFDPATEKVIGDDQANRLLAGHYRAPYVMPDLT